MKRLQARKQDLLVESAINRQILRLECEQLRFRAEGWRSQWTRAQDVWKWAAPIAGFFFARKFRPAAGAFTAAAGWIPPLRKLWAAWREKRHRTTDD